VSDAGYTDRAKIRIAGIINSKKTKVTKNGDTMAFVTVEDRYAEIEVIVFARQYSECSAELFVENAVVIDGQISVEDGDQVRIILSAVRSLGNGTGADSKQSEVKAYQPRIYLKLPNTTDRVIEPIYRIANFNRGDAAVIIFDESTQKYVALKGLTMAQNDKVREKLSHLFGDKNIVFK
jgi:DNA polymerase-3 subunit alpha